jgi:small subunit ribosomal protein S13
MARIAGVNIPQNKVVKAALTYIFGRGDKTAKDICNELKIDKNKRTNALTDDEV